MRLQAGSSLNRSFSVVWGDGICFQPLEIGAALGDPGLKCQELFLRAIKIRNVVALVLGSRGSPLFTSQSLH